MTIKRFNVKAGLSVGPNTPIDVIDANGNATFGSITANLFTGNINASTIFQNANFYDTRIELGSASGIVAITTNGNTTQFLPSGQINLGGSSKIAGGTFAGSELELASAQTNLKQLRDGNVTVQVGTGGTATTTWTFANTGNLILPSNTSAINYANGTSILNGDANFANLMVNGLTNLGNIANITILGGTNAQFLQTDGNGVLQWANAAGATENVPYISFTATAGQTVFTSATLAQYPAGTPLSVFRNGVLMTPSEYSISGSTLTASIYVSADDLIEIPSRSVAASSSVGYADAAGVAYSVSGSNVSGAVGTANFANFAGNVTVAAQPNITSVGNLTTLVVSGTANIANLRVTGNVVGNLLPDANITYDLGSSTQRWRDLWLSNSTIHIGGQTISAGANGVVLSGDTTVPNITADETGIVSITGNMVPTANGQSLGTSQSPWSSAYFDGTITANTFTGNGSQLTGIQSSFANLANYATTANSVAGANVTGTVANATYATTAGVANSVAAANITGTISFATNSTNANIANSATLANFANFAGNVTVAAQPNITSLGSLTSLTVNGTITANGSISLKAYTETSVNAASSSTFAPDLSTGTIQRFTANSNFTFNGFTNPVSGQSGMCIITQDGTGSRVMTSTMKFAGNAKTLSTAANSVDIIAVFYDGISYYASLTKGYA